MPRRTVEGETPPPQIEQFDHPFKPFTEAEIQAALRRLHARRESFRSNQNFEDRSLTFLVKDIPFEGGRTFRVSLEYDGPVVDRNFSQIYIPFTGQTKMSFDLESGKSPKVELDGLEVEVREVFPPEAVELGYVLSFSFPTHGVQYQIHQEANWAGEIKNTRVVGTKYSRAFLPSDQSILPEMEISIGRPHPLPTS